MAGLKLSPRLKFIAVFSCGFGVSDWCEQVPFALCYLGIDWCAALAGWPAFP